MIRALIPLGVFVALIILLVVGLQTSEERKLIQSPLIGKPIPEFSLPTMQDPEARITHNDLIGEPFMLNVWGSWRSEERRVGQEYKTRRRRKRSKQHNRQ